MSIGTIPAILWGGSFANTVSIAHPLDSPNAGSTQRSGTETATAPSGTRDAWVVGTDDILEGEIRHIPIADLSPDDNGENATGWDGATGVKAALEWLLDGNVGRWVPDEDSLGTYVEFYLDEPKEAMARKERDTNRRRLRIRLVATDGSSFTGY